MSQNAKNKIFLILIFLVVFDVLIWQRVMGSGDSGLPEIYFFDVGQGDSELIILPSPTGGQDKGIKILIDGGPGKEKLTTRLIEVLPPESRYLDLVILSHPQTDHFTGFIEVFKNYRVGAFISNGLPGISKAYGELNSVLRKKSIRQIHLLGGDRIKYGNYVLNFVSPTPLLLHDKDINESSLVFILEAGGVKAIFTGDMGFKSENYLTQNKDIDIDILKTPHHGSKYSSGAGFLKATSPKISVIEVGKNSYGHPTKETLSRLANVGSRIFRTDKDGTVKLVIGNNKISVLKK